MNMLRWGGVRVACAVALVVGAVSSAKAQCSPPLCENPYSPFVQSDQAGAILIYPHIEVSATLLRDTVVRMSNSHDSKAAYAHCFYGNANSHCSGGSNSGQICNDNPGLCTGGICQPGWQETDFRIRLTPFQPIQWLASTGLSGSDLPLPAGYCQLNPQRACASDNDCRPFPGGNCTDSNTGTRIPPVAEVPFQGDLRCIVIDANGNPLSVQADANVLKGEAILTSLEATVDVASYNAVGLQSTGGISDDPKTLVIGDPNRPNSEYYGCPNSLVVDHFFDTARDPVPGTNNTITTELIMVPCSVDYLRQVPGSATAQFLVFNEFEQRFSTSKRVDCYDRTQLCRIGTTQCQNSIFNVAVAGTLTGQTRVNPIRGPRDPLGSGLLGVAIESHAGAELHRAAFNLQMRGERNERDLIVIP